MHAHTPGDSRPPIGVYSRKPGSSPGPSVSGDGTDNISVVFLPRFTPADADNKSVHEDDLDRHVEEVLSKRAIVRRTLRGVWAFVKTRTQMHLGFSR